MVRESGEVGELLLVLGVAVEEVEGTTPSVQIIAGHNQEVSGLREAVCKPEILFVVGNFAQLACFPFQDLQAGAGVSKVDLITISLPA